MTVYNTDNYITGENMVVIYIRKNGSKISQSRHESYYGGPSGYAADNGGRTIVSISIMYRYCIFILIFIFYQIFHLAKGETVDLFCQDCSATVYHITFCVSLSQVDV